MKIKIEIATTIWRTIEVEADSAEDVNLYELDGTLDGIDLDLWTAKDIEDFEVVTWEQ